MIDIGLMQVRGEECVHTRDPEDGEEQAEHLMVLWCPLHKNLKGTLSQV